MPGAQGRSGSPGDRVGITDVISRASDRLRKKFKFHRIFIFTFAEKRPISWEIHRNFQDKLKEMANFVAVFWAYMHFAGK